MPNVEIGPPSDWSFKNLHLLAYSCHYLAAILNFEAAILDISKMYVYNKLHIACLDFLSKIGQFDSIRYGHGLYKWHFQYSTWRPF